MQSKTLYLMRHGETLFNARHKIQGACDSPLTEKGIQQAKAAGKYFQDHNITFDAACCSTQERASDTLEIITQKKMPYQRLKGLKERNFGLFESESEELHPPVPFGDYYVKFGGENDEQVEERMSETLLDVMSQAGHDTVLAVSHGGACRGFMRCWEENQKVDWEGRLPNCTILKFAFADNEFALVDVITPVE